MKSIPEHISTNGYCQEILLLQFLHLPVCIRKLNIGTNSYQERVLLQEKHFDLPLTVSPVL